MSTGDNKERMRGKHDVVASSDPNGNVRSILKCTSEDAI